MLWVCSKVISVIMRTLNSDICSSVVSCFQFLNPSECTCDTCVLFSVLSPLSDRGSKPDPHGPQRSVWPLCEDQAHPGPQERDQAEDQDHPLLPQPHLERELHIVSARHGDITPGSVASSTQSLLSCSQLLCSGLLCHACFVYDSRPVALIVIVPGICFVFTQQHLEQKKLCEPTQVW